MNISSTQTLLPLLAIALPYLWLYRRQRVQERCRRREVELLTHALAILHRPLWRVVELSELKDPYAPGGAGELTIEYLALAHPNDVAEGSTLWNPLLQEVLGREQKVTNLKGKDVTFWLDGDFVDNPASLAQRLRCTVVSGREREPSSAYSPSPA